MEIIVNGEVRVLDGPMSLSGFLLRHGLNVKFVVVEHNRVIVPRDRYEEIVLKSGDGLEIVQMMAGG